MSMAVQVSYPGVYVEEFAPGAPIEGVSTSVAAFVGTAMQGPIDRPTLIQSWDAFVARFGPFASDQPAPTLPPAVFGFFVNGGTTCYVLRVGTGAHAEAGLPSRQAGGTPDPALVATALQEGAGGNALTIEVTESSRLAAELRRVLPDRAISAVSADRRTLTVGSNAGFAGEEVVTLVSGSNSAQAVVERTQGADRLVLLDAIPGTTDFTGGTLRAGPGLAVHRAETNVTTVSSDRRTLTVASSAGFARGDRVLLAKSGATSQTVAVDAVPDATTIQLVGPVPGTANFGGGTARTADLPAGHRALRLAVPGGLRLPQTVPAGAVLRLSGTGEIRSVDASTADTVTVADGLAGAVSLSSATARPVVESLEFDLTVSDTSQGYSEPAQVGLSMDARHPAYWRTAVTSELVELDDPDEPPSPVPADPRPQAGVHTLVGGAPDDRAAAWQALQGAPDATLDRLRPVDEISLLAVPGATDPVVQQAMIAHCESLWDRFAILDPLPGVEPGDGIRDQFADVRSQYGFAALYYPRIRARNPLTRRDELWPPSGHLAGVFARIDATRGVHKAPANTVIRGAFGLERQLSDAEQGPLNLMGINVLRSFPAQAQPLVWGARTTATDRNWQYVNVRRLFLYLEETIQEGIAWAVFEPNDLELWQKLRRTITEFLTRVWRDGALFGATAEEAFYVRIDEALNPPSTQALGRLYIEVGVRPTYPAEFIVLRIGIWRGGSEVTES
jgi:uncharacterized protein